MRFALLTRSALVLLACAAAACADERAPTTTPPPDPGETKPPKVLGLYEITISGIGSDQLSATAIPVRPVGGGDGPSAALNPVASGVALEAASTSVFTEGVRPTAASPNSSQIYVTATFRVRNATAGPLTNVTFIMASSAASISGTPISVLRKYDNSAAPASIATKVVPTGFVSIGSDLVTMTSPYPDVLQVFTEAEVAAIPLPAGVTNIFPYGFTVRNKSTVNSRTLPSAAADANQYDGLLTVAYRMPLQDTKANDVFSLTFQALAVEDTQTRLTESIEESQDTAAVRRLRDRATALGATMVTVLNGSPATDPAVTDYPGQRQICDFRTAGTAGAPVNNNRAAGAYSTIIVLRSGETYNSCAAYFRGGTVTPPATNVPYVVSLYAMDRYGNILAGQADTVKLNTVAGGPANVTSAPAALSAGGGAGANVTYSAYGSSLLYASGRRITGDTVPLGIGGVLRTWTAGAGTTNWYTGGNWSPAAVPMSQDSVLIPGDKSFYPVLVQNTEVSALRMTDGVTLQPSVNVGAFDLLVSGGVNGNVSIGNNGTFGGTGRLILSGIGVVGGGLSNFDVRNLRITGSYSATSNLNVTGGRIVVQGGRLRNSGNGGQFRIRVRPF
jgi:hypothetical protein